MKYKIFCMAACLLLASCSGQKSGNSTDERDRFISELISKMTVKEKIGQLNLSGGDVPGVLSGTDGLDDAIRSGMITSTGWNDVKELRRLQRIAVEESRMGIPLMCGLDVIHGLGTIFPTPLALSCSWNPDLIKRTARVAAIEATAMGCNWTYSPMVDIARDPRWGRIAEGSGEDPYLGSVIARAMVEGYQGEDLSDSTTLMACVKHFALYGASEAGRDYNTVDMSKVRMYNEYLPPYKAAVDVGCGSVMSSFNVIDGVPASGNKWLLTTLLRDEWGFKGFVVSDYDSIGEMVQHGMGDLTQVSALALKAGMDMDMMTKGYVTTLEKSLEKGLVSGQDIDLACRRVLEAKYNLGLFDDPYRYLDTLRKATDFMTEANMRVAREAAAESVVLLKNEDNLLPLERCGTIAVIGPMAFTKQDLLGMWSGSWDEKSLTIAEAIRESAGENARVIEAVGCHLTDEPKLADYTGIVPDPEANMDLVRQAVRTASQADAVVAVLGEPRSWSGEACSRSDISLPESQRILLKALCATGKPVILVLANGRPLAVEQETGLAGAVVEAWHGGSQAAKGLADVIFGDVNPSAKLSVTFPRSVGQIPIYYNCLNTGRPQDPDDHYTSKYLDIPNEPLFPFGFGLSYTSFSYGSLNADKKELQGDGDVLNVSVSLKNTGSREGTEIVQLYVGDPVASISRPIKELKDFKRVSLEPGEEKEVVFKVTTEQLKFYNSALEYGWEPGLFNIFVGFSSSDVQKVSVNWQK